MMESLVEDVADSFVGVLVIVIKLWCKVGGRRKKGDDCTCT